MHGPFDFVGCGLLGCGGGGGWTNVLYFPISGVFTFMFPTQLTITVVGLPLKKTAVYLCIRRLNFPPKFSARIFRLNFSHEFSARIFRLNFPPKFSARILDICHNFLRRRNFKHLLIFKRELISYDFAWFVAANICVYFQYLFMHLYMRQYFWRNCFDLRFKIDIE